MFKQDIAVIVSDYRTGGTFLSLALDSHPRIYCSRDEVLAHSSTFMRHMPNPNPVSILKIEFDRGLADVCMTKLVYRQIKSGVAELLGAARPKVVHLIRQNQLRAAISLYFHHQVRQGKVSGEGRALRMWTAAGERQGKPEPIPVDPATLLARIQARIDNKDRWDARMKGMGLQVMVLTYEQLVGGEGVEAACIPQPIADKLCRFLGVEPRPLCSQSRKVNAWPLRELVSNWAEVEKAIRGSPYARYLEEEEQYG